MHRIYIDEFLEEWRKAYDDWDGKFSAKLRQPQSIEDEGRSYCFFIWHGPHVIFDNTELIPGKTLVTGTGTSPEFHTPTDFLESFEYTDLDPITRKRTKAGEPYYHALTCLKNCISENAASKD
ncbi:MAG: hypothetical protein Q4D80_00700 [Pseudomonadota bacterium]|nr:hypothetical protein [Pseudomonadota bacterium]